MKKSKDKNSGRSKKEETEERLKRLSKKGRVLLLIRVKFNQKAKNTTK